MTWSILARDPATGWMGAAVASRYFAVGAVIPHIRDRRSAVATQAYLSPLWGIEGADRIAAGEAPEAVLADLIARDGNHARRQWHALDGSGRIAAHTGEDCVGWAGHLAADDVSVAGNMLAGPQVLSATLDTFLAARDQPLPDRLLLAMEAGEAAGGDSRGRQSAALRVHRGEAYPWLDLRADDHGEPLAEIRRLLDVARERFVHVAETMPTAADFSGPSDRSAMESAIARAEAERAARGVASRSLASPSGLSLAGTSVQQRG